MEVVLTVVLVWLEVLVAVVLDQHHHLQLEQELRDKDILEELVVVVQIDQVVVVVLVDQDYLGQLVEMVDLV